jgi:hypothetical protein
LKVLPEEAASRRRFYAVESDESPRDNRIEDFLSLVEGYAADPIRTLLERPMELTEADRTTIALMLALQERRTPFGVPGSHLVRREAQAGALHAFDYGHQLCRSALCAAVAELYDREVMLGGRARPVAARREETAPVESQGRYSQRTRVLIQVLT